jgi:hypothetical protein
LIANNISKHVVESQSGSDAKRRAQAKTFAGLADAVDFVCAPQKARPIAAAG